MLSPRQSFARLGLAYFLLLAATVGLQYAVSFLISRFIPAIGALDVYPWLLSLLPLYAVGLPICLLVLRHCPKDNAAPGQPIRPGHWLLALMCTLGLMCFGNLIGNFLMLIVNLLRGSEMVNPVQSLILDANPIWTALATVVVAPLGEEFLFRRLIIDRTRRYGEWTAILVSALAFGLFHLNFYQFFYAFFIGLVFGYVYLRTGRMRYTIALHATVNLLGGVIAPMLVRGYLAIIEPLTEGGTDISALIDTAADALPAMLAYLLYMALIFGCMIATLVFGIVQLARRRIQFFPGSERARPVEIIGNFGVIAYLVACLAFMIINC